MSHSSAPPASIAAERGNDGRLVGLAFHSPRLTVVPETNARFVAVAGSNNTLRAVEHAMHQAGETNACARLLTERDIWPPNSIVTALVSGAMKTPSNQHRLFLRNLKG